MKILWYVSSHGWGHAARQRELIRVYKQSYCGTSITVASDVPQWFWEGSEADAFIPGSPSPVVVESGGNISREKTLAHFHEFMEKSPVFLEAEVRRQHNIKPDLVVTDIDPLPVKAAEITGVPAFGISNFTWDWVMREMFPDMAGETEKLSAMYNNGTYLKLPMGPGHSPFHRTVNIPLLRGGPPGNCRKVDSLLPEGKYCLVALRAIPPGINLTFPENICAVSSLPEPLHPKCLNIPPAVLAEAGATFADLVHGCEVLVSRPGYGIVSQILAMGKRAILFSGRQFPEERFLLSALVDRQSVFTVETQSSVSLKRAINILLKQKNMPEAASDGADFITELINTVY